MSQRQGISNSGQSIKKLMGQLYGWMHQLPVIGFNSGKYDLNAIKQFLILYFLSTSKTKEQQEEQEKEQDDKEKEEENDGIGSFFFIERNNTCLSTDQLKFLDMTNYISSGTSTWNIRVRVWRGSTTPLFLRNTPSSVD